MRTRRKHNKRNPNSLHKLKNCRERVTARKDYNIETFMCVYIGMYYAYIKRGKSEYALKLSNNNNEKANPTFDSFNF